MYIFYFQFIFFFIKKFKPKLFYHIIADIKYIMPNNYVEFIYFGRLRRFKVIKVSTNSTIVNQDNENAHNIYYINNKLTNVHWIPYVEKTKNVN